MYSGLLIPTLGRWAVYLSITTCNRVVFIYLYLNKLNVINFFSPAIIVTIGVFFVYGFYFHLELDLL